MTLGQPAVRRRRTCSAATARPSRRTRRWRGACATTATGNVLANSVDENTDQAFMVSGQDVFGGFSGQVRGTARPRPRHDRRHPRSPTSAAPAGRGSPAGSIQISNGTITKVDRPLRRRQRRQRHRRDQRGRRRRDHRVDRGGRRTACNSPAARATTSPSPRSAAEPPPPTWASSTPVAGGAGVPVDRQRRAAARHRVHAAREPQRRRGHQRRRDCSITNGEQTATVAVPAGGTVGDLLNAINASGTGVRAVDQRGRAPASTSSTRSRACR